MCSCGSVGAQIGRRDGAADGLHRARRRLGRNARHAAYDSVSSASPPGSTSRSR